MRGEVLKMGFSQGRKHLPLSKNSHHPQLLAPLGLCLPWWSWRGCRVYIPGKPLEIGKWQWGDTLALGGTGGKPSCLKGFWAFLHLAWGGSFLWPGA